MNGYGLWISTARVLIPIEGIIGMALNAFLIFNLSQSRMEKTATVYHYSCVISAVSSFYFAFLVVMIVDVGELVDGILIGVLYGPHIYLPPRAAEAVTVAFMVQLHTTWQTVPAPSILQWLSLSRRQMSNFTKMMYAYTVPIVFHIIGWITMIKTVAPPELYEEMVACAIRVQGTNRSEFRVYGARLLDDTGFSVADIAVFDFLPSFTASYGLFVWTASKVRKELHAGGAKLSAKTAQMQRRFYRTQLVQVTLPLVLPTIPIGIVIFAVFSGLEVPGMSFIYGLIMWPIPCFTAVLLLVFVQKSSTKIITVKKSKISGVEGIASMTTMHPI